MAGISTHVLDNYTGRPGAGMRIDFSSRQTDGSWKLVKTLTTNTDGRTDGPVLAPADAAVGEYELAFHVADFYEPKRGVIGDPVFLDRVVPLPHPRHYSVKTTPVFTELKAELTEAVRTEVLAAQAAMA